MAPGPVRDTTGVDELPIIRHIRGLSYPSALRRRGIQGQVIMAFVVQPDGHVDPKSVQVVEASDQGFAASSKRFVRDEIFWPACLGGKRVPVRIQQPLNFRLTGAG